MRCRVLGSKTVWKSSKAKVWTGQKKGGRGGFRGVELGMAEEIFTSFLESKYQGIMMYNSDLATGSSKQLLTSPWAGSGGSWKASATATRPALPPTEAGETFATFGEGPLLQPPQTSPMAGLDGSSKPPLMSPRAGSGGPRKASATATQPASPEAREATTTSRPVCSTVTTQPLAAPSLRPQAPSGAPCTPHRGRPLPGAGSGSPSHSWVDSPAPPRDSSPCLLGGSRCPPCSS